MKITLSIVTVAIVTALAWGPAQAALVTLSAVADTEILPEAPYDNSNHGLGFLCYVGYAGAGDGSAMVRFDISSIPAGQTIQSATLTLTVGDTSGSPLTVSGYRLSSSWVEGDGDFNGLVENVGTFGATWNSRDKSGGPAMNWITPGTDHIAAASFTAAPVSGVLAVDVTGDVQGWYAGTDNNGWVIQTEALEGYVGYRSRFYGAAGPQLTITYAEIPEPASAALLGLGGLALLRRRPA